LAAVVAAVELAERSAAEGRAAEGLEEAVIRAVMTAGGALTGIYGSPTGEPAPADGNAGIVASVVAKVAEKAAEAAQKPPPASAYAALEAYGFARQAASEEPAILEAMRFDWARLHHLAQQEEWTDETAVPPGIWQE
jgi:hypothetical protein